jgi:hypothetical protein
MPSQNAPARTAHWLWPPLLLVGCVTAIISWLLIALRSGSQASWMAPLSALEIVWMLRLGSLPRSHLRISLAVLATVAVILATNLGIAAGQIGAGLGLDPWTSATKLGAQHARTLLSLANDGYDIICYVIAVLLALWSSR